MKIKATQQDIERITAALALMHVRPFSCESSDAKWNAQRNLSGKTHYVDDDTLRWHKSRVLSSGNHAGGLLFRLVCSDAMDMHNTRRGFRVVWFDVFGTCVTRPDLDECKATRKAAEKADDAIEFDLVAHYSEALTNQQRQSRETADTTQKAVELLKL